MTAAKPRQDAQGERTATLTLVSVRLERGRALLSLSSGETLAMPRAMLKERPYRSGMPFDKAAFDAFLSTRSRPFAMARAVSLLAIHARTQKELRTALESCAYPDAVIDGVLAYLEQAGYLDDPAFASRWAASRVAKGLGARRIQAELRAKGIDAEAVTQAVARVGEEALTQSAMAAARKLIKGKNLSDTRDRQRILAALSRRGFTYAQAKRALDGLRGEDGGSL